MPVGVNLAHGRCGLWYNMGQMNRFTVFWVALSLACVVQASWYWPFGSSDDDANREPRVSELMEKASELVDEASDLAAERKTDESVAKYREALEELDRIERAYPERVKKPEFATLRNRRAYINAAIDQMLLGQVRANARSVAVSDTTELEKRRAKELGQKDKDEVVAEKKPVEKNPVAVRKPAEKKAETPMSKKAWSKREQAIADIAKGDYDAAELIIREMLAAKPHGATALNLKAAMEMKQDKLKEAEDTLDQAISFNPHSYSAYYNMAWLMLKKNPDNKAAAKRMYDAGREHGKGPQDAQLEAALK